MASNEETGVGRNSLEEPLQLSRAVNGDHRILEEPDDDETTALLESTDEESSGFIDISSPTVQLLLLMAPPLVIGLVIEAFDTSFLATSYARLGW
ncbi:hypothetical protein ABW20_dc0100359 [Dactylellina cionopaga]|nr:hypothetical protein ABW20_dc0100359 [Dactylellina cionopaga]